MSSDGIGFDIGAIASAKRDRNVPIPASTLDEILSWQVLIAWAGEALCEPARLGWWRTDLVDEYGGGDLLRRLLPETYRWAALEAMREAAIRTDTQKRQRLARADEANTLFCWGFEIDEQLPDQWAALKPSREAPENALDFMIALAPETDVIASTDFARERLENVLADACASGRVEYKVVSEGRTIQQAAGQSLHIRVQRLVNALLPLIDDYPMPFYLISATNKGIHGA